VVCDVEFGKKRCAWCHRINAVEVETLDWLLLETVTDWPQRERPHRPSQREPFRKEQASRCEQSSSTDEMELDENEWSACSQRHTMRRRTDWVLQRSAFIIHQWRALSTWSQSLVTIVQQWLCRSLGVGRKTFWEPIGFTQSRIWIGSIRGFDLWDNCDPVLLTSNHCSTADAVSFKLRFMKERKGSGLV